MLHVLTPGGRADKLHIYSLPQFTTVYLGACQLPVLLLSGRCLEKDIGQEVVTLDQLGPKRPLLLSAPFLPLAPWLHLPFRKQQRLVFLGERNRGLKILHL